MKVSFSLVIDSVFTAFIGFVLSFVVFNYFIERPYSIVFAGIFSALLTLFTVRKMLKNSFARYLKKQDQQAYDNMLTQLNFSSKAENYELFEKLFGKMGYDTERKKGGVFFKDKNAAVFIMFGFQEVRKADIVKIFNTIRKKDVAYILSESFSSDVKSFADRFDGRIKTVDGKAVFSALKSHDALPVNKYVFTPAKTKGVKLLKNLLYKRKAKSYLSFGVIFLLTSYFVPIKLYYVIFGCVFLLAALLCRAFGIAEDNA